MATNIDSLKRLIETIRTIGFWRRLFSWSAAVKNQLIDAVANLQTLLTTQETTADQLQQQRQQIADLTKDLSIAREQSIRQQIDMEKKQQELLKANEAIIDFKSKETQRQNDHSKLTATLTSIQNKIQADREAETREARAREIQHLEGLRFTWSNHQLAVSQAIKALCQKHTIEYIGKVPFKGDPDNTIKIAGEYIVFDAKSPRGDDLSNFPGYIREQAEKAKKYAGEPDVKKWVFFIVPENTLAHIGAFVYHLADYQVFVVATDSLEPILLSLKKVEEYEFADQLSPEDRENICRILGKFAHLSKRRIQIDTYFINQFMDLARKCENDLPSEILDEAIEFEKAEKLNPPMERRTKLIPTAELDRAAKRAITDAANHGILPAEEQLTTILNTIPLYAEEK